MLRIRLLTVSLAAAVTTASVPARAQVVSDSDFFSISSVEVGLFAERDFEVTISANTKTPMMTMVFPLSYAGHPDLRVDLGTGDQGVTFDSIANLPAWYVRSALVDTTAKTILIGLVGFAMPMPPSVGPVATIHFTLDSSDTPGVVYVDSTFVPPGNHLTFVDEAAVEYVPQFTPGVITISDQIPIIRFNLSRVTIRGYADSTSPVSGDFMILNDGGGMLHWTATTDQPWLSVVPDTGTGDLMVSAVADITAMPVGKYTATITVTDPEAINSPKTLPVLITELMPLGFKGLMAAAKKKVQTWTAQDIGVEPEMLDPSNAKVKMLELFIPVHEGKCEYVTGETPEEAGVNLHARLRKAKLI